jgi:Sec-independent protein translocase protein TatA
VDPFANQKREIHMIGEIFGLDGMVVLIVLLALLFGGAAIPKLARSLGSAKNEFEKGLDARRRVPSSSSTDVSVAAHPAAALPSTNTSSS